MAQTFRINDIVSYVGGKSGKTIICKIVNLTTSGVMVVWQDDPTQYRTLHASKLTLIERPEAAQKTQATAQNGLRYQCNECGKRYNGSTCPRCGGRDRVLNTDESTIDMSYLLNH